MNLVIDIGNTSSKVAIFENNQIVKKQVFNIENNKIDVNLTKNLVDLTYELHGQLQDNNIDNIGNILHQGWQIIAQFWH